MSDDKDQIAKRAYQIWEEQGRPAGQDFDHWHQAEQELRANPTAPPSEAKSPPKKKQREPASQTAQPKAKEKKMRATKP